MPLQIGAALDLALVQLVSEAGPGRQRVVAGLGLVPVPVEILHVRVDLAAPLAERTGTFWIGKVYTVTLDGAPPSSGSSGSAVPLRATSATRDSRGGEGHPESDPLRVANDAREMPLAGRVFDQPDRAWPEAPHLSVAGGDLHLTRERQHEPALW